MRFGLIGDVHAEHERLQVALRALGEARVDRLLCVGDLVDGHGDVDRTCALLAEHQVTTVRGNHDRWIRDDDMRTLPLSHRMTSLAPASIALLKSLTIELPVGKLLLCHAVGTNDMQRLGPDDSGYAISSNEDLLKVLFDPSIAIMVCGHGHVPMVRRFERNAGKTPLVVVNAGTLARDDNPGFAIFDAEARRVDFYRIVDNLTVSPLSPAVLSPIVCHAMPPRMDTGYLRREVVVEPIWNSWHAWPLLVAPATAGAVVRHQLLPPLISFVEQPHEHARLLRDPGSLGGPYVALAPERVEEARAHLDHTRSALAGHALCRSARSAAWSRRARVRPSQRPGRQAFRARAIASARRRSGRR